MRMRAAWLGCLLVSLLVPAPEREALADPAAGVLDANARAVAVASTIRATPVAVRAMAIVQVAAHDAAVAITRSGRTFHATVEAPVTASVEAAVASATRDVLLALVPEQRDAIERDFAALVEAVPAGASRDQGVAVGARAARAALEARGRDGATASSGYRFRTAPGVYVPTAQPLVPHWGRRVPWAIASGHAVRPPAPPSLDSETWRRDLAEIRAMGAREGSARTPEQTAAARFWETTSPSVYWPLAREVAAALPRDATERLRLLAEAAVAMDDAIIAVFDAKYAYGFWRPITAVRAAAGAEGDSTWQPLIETPMHPEYPCAHCIVSGALATVLETELAGHPSPPLSATSPTSLDGEHRWSSPAEFAREVSEARIWAGVHYRNSTVVGQAMGREVGRAAADRFRALAR